MAQPSKETLAQLKRMADEERLRKQLKDQYQSEMAKRYERDVVPFAQWMGERQKSGMAQGGTAHLAEGGEIDQPLKLFTNHSEKAKKMIDAVYGQYPVWPLNENQRAMVYGEGENQQLGNFELKPSLSAKDAVELAWLSSYPHKQGVGSRTLQALQQHAAEHGVGMTLYPWDKGGVSQAKLMKFYKKHGFVPTQKGAKNMIWRPKGLAQGGAAHLAGGGQPNLDTMRLALTRNGLGMHSPLEKAIINSPRTKGTAQEFMTEASKQPGFKKEELEDRPLSLPEGKMSKQEFLGHIQGQPSPKIQAKTFHSNYEGPGIGDDQTYHEEYTLPGGSNYREILLQRPQWKGGIALMQKEAELRRLDPGPWRDKVQGEVNALRAAKQAHGEVFKGLPQHFGGEPGVIASLMVKDRVGPNGEKVYHIDELQSDWHQHGRKKGYKNPEEEKRRDAELAAAKQMHHGFLEQMKAKYGGDRLEYVKQMTPEEKDEARRLAGEFERVRQSFPVFSEQVPDAPHKKSWHELALKHALTEAAQGGYHGIAISPGHVLADRYSLSKHINDLQYDPQTKTVMAWDHSGNQVVHKSGIDEKDLPQYIGKEGAQKLLAQNPSDTHIKQLFGADLKVGGEGMKGFYDKILVDALNKLGKKHGAQVAMHSLAGTGGMEPFTYPIASLHYFPITDSLRKQILSEGLPQYKAGGTIEGQTMQPTLAQMKMALTLGQNAIKNIGVQEAPNMSPKLSLNNQNESYGELPTGGVDLDPMQPGKQLMPAPSGAPMMGQAPQMPLQSAQTPQPPSNILQMTRQGQALNAIRPPQQPQQVQAKAKGGRAQSEASKVIGKAAQAAGMNAPVTATKDLTTINDFHQSLGDSIRQRAADMQNLMESLSFKYDKGHRVFTKSSAERRLPPYTVLARRLAGNQPMREDHPQLGPGMGKPIKDPNTGKTMRTPYEPGYLVRHEMGPEDWQEFVLPEKSILGHVDFKEGGSTNKYNPTATKASEALGKHEGKHLKVTQADRTKVGGGFLGGPGFSSLQHVDPAYEGMAWGVNSPAAASKIINAAKAHPEGQALFSTLIGAPTQHTSNQMVFDMMLDQFKKAIKAGKMSPELRAAINQKLQTAMVNDQPVFEPGANISSKNFFQNLDTFDKRRILADLMGGIGVGGKKGQLFDYDKIVNQTTEPELRGAPTHSIGPRLFTVTGERSNRPDLHPAFPHMIHGEDLGQLFHPVPRELMLPDFHEHVKKTKGRKVGFMDLTRNTPSQFLSEQFLTNLQKQGYKKGGKVAPKQSMDTMRLALTKKAK